jgi:preprotein translocase subunit SecA
MVLSVLTKIFGSKNEREMKRMQPIVDAVMEPKMQALGDDRLRALTGQYKERIERGEPLDDLLVEAFAVVREASVRSLKMRHFDVQLIGGTVLHQRAHRRDENR